MKTHKLSLDKKLLHLSMGIILGLALWGGNACCAVDFELGKKKMITKTEIPKIGKIYDKLGHPLIVLEKI